VNTGGVFRSRTGAKRFGIVIPPFRQGQVQAGVNLYRGAGFTTVSMVVRRHILASLLGCFGGHKERRTRELPSVVIVRIPFFV
jgi:hypothetical protein